MRRVLSSVVFLLSALTFGVFPAVAELPADAIVVEAESMRLPSDSDGWIVREHDVEAWYLGQPSNLKYLGGQSAAPSVASTTVSLPQAGQYSLWVRYLDMVNYRSNNGFRIQGTQNGGETFDHEFDNVAESPRSTPEGNRKWGNGFARWVWTRVSFEAQSGSLEIQLSKIKPVAVHGCGRNVDVLILTADASYEPAIMDLYPFYVRIKALEGQTIPVGIHFFGKRAFSPYYTEHANFTQTGWTLGVMGGMDKPEALLYSGTETPWVNIASQLAYGGRNCITLYAMRDYWTREPEAFFEVSFSKTPSETGIIKTIRRTGTGNGLFFSINLTDYELLTEVDESAANLARAKATPEVPGCVPRKFPFFTGLAIDRERSIAQSVKNEEAALATIGLTRQKLWPANHFFHQTLQPGCLGQPDTERIEAGMKGSAENFLRRHGSFSQAVCLNAMDEPGFGFEHVANCEYCKSRFEAYLKSIHVDNADGIIRLNNDPQAEGIDAKRSYYYTRRYVNNIMTQMLRSGTIAAQKYWGNIPVTVNFATETLSGNMAKRGLDWYEIFDSGALTYGWSEDWAGWARTYQANGYLLDALRSACRQKDVPFGFYDVLCGASSWEIQAKGFLETGHGAKAISFFNYGPVYALSSDTNSRRPEIYEAIKRFTYATGAVEDALLTARPTRADIAMLHSITGDIWRANGENVFGRERVSLALLLRHGGYAVDVLGESELKQELNKYSVLFVTDRWLRRELVPALVDWVKSGGFLYVSAGALERDEFDAPLGALEQLGIERPTFELVQEAGRPEYEMPNLKALDYYDFTSQPVDAPAEGPLQGSPSPQDKTADEQTQAFEKIKIVCAHQGAPLELVEGSTGAGKVALVGFFPGISYLGSAVKPNYPTKYNQGTDNQTRMGKDCYSVWNFPAAHRAFVSQILNKAKVIPRVQTDNYRVEANLLEGPQGDIVALSNWTGTPQTVTVWIGQRPGARPYSTIRSVTGTILNKQIDSAGITVTIQIGPGDYLELD